MKRLNNICFNVYVTPFDDNEHFLLSVKELKGKDSEKVVTSFVSRDEIVDLLMKSLNSD